MKTEITVSRFALIGTIVTAIAGIVVALITHFTPSTPVKPSPQPTPSADQSLPPPVQGSQVDVTVQRGNGNINVDHGDVITHTTHTTAR
ncbi:MAG: hypothetical protein WBP54_05890 [Pelodictyon phaeoclathratiforme]